MQEKKKRKRPQLLALSSKAIWTRVVPLSAPVAPVLNDGQAGHVAKEVAP
jgi:hypothetical protein